MIARAEARAARRQFEEALDLSASSSGWRWTIGLSRWIDVLLVIESDS